MNTEAGKAIVVAKSALFALYVQHVEGCGFNMDKYTSVEKSLDDAFKACGFAGRTPTHLIPDNKSISENSYV